MSETMTPGQRLFQSWTAAQAAEARRQMAEQTLRGAEREVQDKRSRFMGQLEFVAGGPCSWKVNVETKEIEVELLPEAPKSEAEIVELPGIGIADGPAGAEPPSAAPGPPASSK